MPSPLLNNRYRILQPLGSGGFGDTFLAEDTHLPSQRRCVIKKLRPAQQTSQVYQLIKERFQREAVILEELGNSHSQIPSLYAYFEIHSEFYLVQEWIEGESLDQRLQRKGPFSDSEVRSLLVQLLPVLAFIHQNQIVHRDIKLDNIILRINDDQPVLIDFGAVKETMGTVVNSTGQSNGSIVIGTPGFMPQEQAVGRPVFSSDLFSLGLTAISLLCGCHPSELSTDPLTGEILWRDRAPMVSPALAEVLDRAIRPHFRDRYPTAQAMLQNLQEQRVQRKQVSPPVAYTTTVIAPKALSTPSQGFSDVQRILITSGIVGMCLAGAIALAQLPQVIASRSQPTETKTSETTPHTSAKGEQDSPISPSSPSISIAPNEAISTLIQKPSSRDFIKEHYRLLNQGDYEITWRRLSSKFKAKSGGYAGYIDWWNKVAMIEIGKVYTLQQDKEHAVVEAELHYLMKRGDLVPDDKPRIFLIWDDTEQSWLIDNKKARP